MKVLKCAVQTPGKQIGNSSYSQNFICKWNGDTNSYSVYSESVVLVCVCVCVRVCLHERMGANTI